MKKMAKKTLWKLGPWMQPVSIFVAMIVIGFLVGPFVSTSMAFSTPNGMTYGNVPAPVKTTANITDLVCAITVWIFWGLLIFSIIMLFVGGYKYATAQGEPERVQSANKTLLYAVIAVVVALVAAGVPSIVDDFLSGGTTTFVACV